MNIRQALIWAIQKLKNKSKTSSLDAEVLLSFVIKKTKEFLYTYPEKILTTQQLKKFKSLVNRRTKGEPVTYLTNHKEFYGLDFYVDKRVLIPRPETELIVDEIIKKNQESRIKNQVIADIGTGSGCIAISLAKHLPNAKVIASDISKAALLVAKKNAKVHKVKIKFLRGNLLEPIKNQKIDIIVANLPYGSKNIWKNTESIKLEPNLALYAKKSGLDIYEKFFKQVNDLKSRPKFILIEIDPSQVENIKKIIKQYLPKSKLEIKKDLASLNRIAIIKL